ncbi:hypothetical protein [Escherichia marmotae]|uniref:hypothetical protein n=1 Tax=Escherichia marmotae TaxID=1499973 RepID=UPI003CF2A29A
MKRPKQPLISEYVILDVSSHFLNEIRKTASDYHQMVNIILDGAHYPGTQQV